MSYSVNQYLHPKNSNNEGFMTQIEANLLKVEPIQNESFSNTGLVYNSYQRAKNYFINCEIGKLSSEQVFLVKLVNKNDYSRQQFIKKIIIQPGGTNINNMVKINFIFTPVENFDTLVFELQRTQDDINPRIPHFLFRELSEIHNIITNKIIKEKLLKIGVQATPGTKMCINNEEIQVGKTGVYEINNEDVQIYSFSVVAPAQYGGTEQNLNTERQIALNKNYGHIHMANNNNNIIPSFILDYIYEEGQ